MKPNHIDERGTITDLLVTPEYSMTEVTFKKGAVRGNHYHEKTLQIDVIVRGNLLCVYENEEGKFSFEMKTGSTITLKVGVKHAYKAIEDSVMMSFCWGVRLGEDYEKDVIRLKEPLIW